MVLIAFKSNGAQTAVDERLEHLIHVGTDGEDQVSTVFDLIVGGRLVPAPKVGCGW